MAKKIMFADKYGLTKAVLEGKKTQTRRVVPKDFFSLNWDVKERTLVYENDFGDFVDIRNSKYALFHVGEIVAVAQSYKNAGYKCFPYHDTDEYFYLKRDGVVMEGISVPPKGCTNKMFVKPELMPHQIRITDVRVERLQEISDEDCLKEGVQYIDDIDLYYCKLNNCKEKVYFRSLREAYAALIDKVSGKGTWDKNPYVFVYDFELIK